MHETDTPAKVALTDEVGLVPKPPNIEGETICHVRWMVETSAGWLGAWDRRAFDAYAAAAVAAERERWRDRVDRAPVAIMDTRTVLSLCAPTEADFPALYALQGRRVALVDLGSADGNADISEQVLT